MDLHYDFGADPANPAQHRVEQLERLAACFQSVIGHDLPNRLIALQGLARLLEDQYANRLDEPGRALLRRLADLSMRSDGLVRTLAEIGRMTRDPGPVEAAPLPEVAREAAAEVNLLCSGWSVEYHFTADASVLRVSRRSLLLVLIHLIRNAVEAGGGRARPLELGSRRTAEGVEWWVQDDGRGLSESQQGRLFECSSGGLGLFLVRQLVAGWGGAVRVHSQPGSGTTFTILVRTA
ncbi:MAG TPA: HAMP domain-containing sensor histidine kinase [Gemmataceae bacterium]|nr:HAMP domain-containing sensor histidine kinase [Gemmataceae bacterium]